MLYAEEQRLLSKESNLIDVATEYTRNNVAWGTIHDYGNITLTEAALLVFFYEVGKVQSGDAYKVNHRLKIGSFYVSGGGGNAITTDYMGINGLVWLAAGIYAVVAEGITGATATVKIQNMKVGVANFNDLSASTLAAYAGAISKTVTARTTCIGALAKCVFAVNVYATTPGEETNFEDVGDNLTNGVSISVDAVQVNWAVKLHDPNSDTYGAAMAKARITATVGAAHSVTIALRDANTVVHISVVATPWILPALEADLYNPVTLDIPQFSTLYIVTEPLESNGTKYSYIGKIRAVNFNATSNYYYSATGVDILTATYTFECVNAATASLVLYGLGSCISHLGVDAV